MYNYAELPVDEATFFTVCDEADLPNGERIFVQIKGKDIVIINIAGRLYALADLCSHDGGPLGEGNLEGEAIKCPRHGARFSLATGKALNLPAVEDIPVYPVRVVDKQVLVGLPKKK